MSAFSTSTIPVDRPQTLLVVPHNPPKTELQDENQDTFYQHLTKDGDFQCPKCLLPIGPVQRRVNQGFHITFRAATGAPALPPWTQLPTWVHTYEVCARPEHLKRFFTEALGPHEAYRLLQLSNLRAHLRTLQTSLLHAVANHRAGEWRHDLRSTSNRAVTGQGLHYFGDNVSPHHGNRAPRWIYPNLIDSGTTCR